MPTEKDDAEDVDGEVGTRWAVLVAGSAGYGNYRHQVFFFFSYGCTRYNMANFKYNR